MSFFNRAIGLNSKILYSIIAVAFVGGLFSAVYAGPIMLGNLENQFLNPSPSCSGSAACIPGLVTANVDGDTLKVYGKSIRLVLVDAPDSNEPGFQEASDFIANACPPGSFAVVDEDDLQTEGSFGRIIGVVYCDGVNVNDAILDAGLADLLAVFCSQSEFENDPWAQEHGC